MKQLLFMALLGCVLWLGCKKSDDDNNNPPPGNSGEVASGTVTSEDSAHIVTPDGAYIDVPVGAVPLTIDSSVGTMIFSIERIEGEVNEVNPPAGMTRVERAYRFGPEGFVFEQPVEVALPVEGEYLVGEIQLARINPTTRVPEFVSADYDPEAGVIRAQTQEMSDWDIYRGISPLLTYGRIRVTANFDPPGDDLPAYRGLTVCAENFVPRFPEDTVNAPILETSVASGHGRIWTIPQGTYQMCVQFKYWRVGDSFYTTKTYTLPNVVVETEQGWVQSPDFVNFGMTITQDQYDASTLGSCACLLHSTPSPGTGELQVTLTWYNPQALDLDLWVTDPNDDRCYYANSPSESGGELDRDNQCANYTNGAPENIFWATAPNGIYTVEVNWYSDCGNGITDNTFSVRVAGAGLAPITEGNLQIRPGETITVGQYELSGGAITQLPFDPVVTHHEPMTGPAKTAAH